GWGGAVGSAERWEGLRVGLVSAGLAGVGVPYVPAAGLWLLAVLSTVTFGQRVLAVHAATRPGRGPGLAEGGAEAPEPGTRGRGAPEPGPAGPARLGRGARPGGPGGRGRRPGAPPPAPRRTRGTARPPRGRTR